MSEVVIDSAERSAALLAVLGNAKRLLVMHHLLQDELAVNELARRVNLSQSAISQHLARLREAGLVETRRDRQTIYYSSRSEIARRLLGALDGYFSENQSAAE
ncbi:transcriptional regulator [Tianweitania populi]|uniref:Transcriptional regulator n=1 Tax=Tianweitania populi TaxID=1607949 RepID=A0A8J3DZI8_9HYPH|nr:transcriptional regulator [Tianweitania populi]